MNNPDFNEICLYEQKEVGIPRMKRGQRKQLLVDMGMADLGFAPRVMARALNPNTRTWKRHKFSFRQSNRLDRRVCAYSFEL